MGDAIDTLVEGRMERGSWTGVALAIKRGADLDCRCYGYADLEHSVPVTKDSVFRIGSLTKQYTAALVLKLSEGGQLSIDDEITDYLPDYPVEGRKVTIHHLLAHTSGLPNYGSLPEVRHRPHNLSPQEIAEKVKNLPIQFEPGERCVYNNFGYHLLGLIVEKVTGTPYRTCVKEYLAEPLGLKNTLYLDNAPVVANRVKGYSLHDGRLTNALHLNINLPYAAGAIGASIKDLVGWQTALNEFQLLNKSSIDMMRTPIPLSSGKSNVYGYGVAVANLDGSPKITHTGGINGFASVLSYYPDDGLTIAVLVNTQPSNPWAVESEIARLVLEKPATAVAAENVPTERLDRYCGVYATDDGNIKVQRAENALMCFSQRYIPVGGDVFVNSDDIENRIRFSVLSGVVREARIGREGIDALMLPITQ